MRQRMVELARIAAIGALPFLPGCGRVASLDPTLQAQETAGLAELAQVVTAQNIHLTEHDGRTAKSVEDLGHNLKPQILAATNSATAYQGYYFVMLPTPEPHRFFAAAIPAQYGASGRRTFLANEEGMIWARDLGGPVLTQPPAKPEAEGWTRVRGGAKVKGPEVESGPGS